MSEITKANLQDALLSIAASTGTGESALTLRLRHALLEFGSSTDDNVNATSRVEVGPIDVATARKGQGMRLTGTNIALTNVVNAAEGCPVPQRVREHYPDIQQEQWDAVLRIACLVLLSFEAPGSKTRSPR
jgi:hypothetical protein